MGAGGEAGEAAEGEAKLLDDDGLSWVPGRAAAPAVTAERPQDVSNKGTDMSKPAGVILGGWPVTPKMGYDELQDLLDDGCF